MTVLQGIKDLIGKEDVNWGNSSSTFARETHSGSSINMHYIDAECVPSTSLGGYVGTHLHLQNTDSLTVATTFGINAAGNSVVLDGTGLSAARTFTFPDASQQLVGATHLLSTATGYGAAMVGIEDAGFYFAGATVETALQEAGADITELESATHNRGMKNGFKLGYASDTALTVSGGMWAHTGTANRHVYTNAQITFTCQSGGSNASSEDFAANTIYYIYIDDSAVVAAGSSLLTAASFLNSSTAPAYSHTKAGWYNGNDRCIGAILTNASSKLSSFTVFGGFYYRYAGPVLEYATATLSSTYTALDLSSSVPKFSTRVRLVITCNNAGTTLNFDTSATAVTPDAFLVSTAHGRVTVDVPTNTSQNLYWYGTPANSADVHLAGYYIDEL